MNRSSRRRAWSCNPRPATLEIRYDADRPAITLADVITVELRIEGTSELQVDIPAGGLKGWNLVKPLETLKKESIGKDRSRWRLMTRFAPDQPGASVSFEYPEVTYHEGKDKHSVKFAKVDFTVTTQFSNADVTQLRDKPEIEALPTVDPPRATPWWWYVAGGSITLLLVVTMIARRYWRRARRQSASELALNEWKRLMALRLPEKGHTERFITLLTLLVRQFLERQFSVPARRRTTPEFLRQLGQIPGMSDAQKQFLTSFLERCEHVKFAQAPIATKECNRLAEETRQFIGPNFEDMRIAGLRM